MTMIIDGTNGITFNNSTVQASAGNVLQVVQGILGGVVSTTSTSLVSTGLTASITPKFSTSKILCFVNLNQLQSTANSSQPSWTIYRNSTNIAPNGSGIFQSFGGIYLNASTGAFNSSNAYLDSPATTSSTTYTVYYASSTGNSVVVNANSNTSTLILMEIAQ